MSTLPTRHPSWDQLFETASAHAGLFTTQQAAEAGYSPQLLVHHLNTGRVGRVGHVRRGIYRLAHFPPDDHEDLTAVWLWSEQKGVFSHQTALAFHNLSDVLPSQLYLTLPEVWSKRRLRVPEGVVLHYGDVASHDRCWLCARGYAPPCDL